MKLRIVLWILIAILFVAELIFSFGDVAMYRFLYGLTRITVLTQIFTISLMEKKIKMLQIIEVPK